MTSLRSSLLLLAALPLGLPSAHAAAASAANPAAPAAKASAPIVAALVRPERRDIHRFITLPATLQPRQQATLYAKVPGYLKSIAVDKGDTVKAGQTLAVIEVPELEADRLRQQAEVSVAESAHRRLAAAQRQSPDLITPLALDEAAGRLAIAKASLDRTQLLLDYARLTAPFDGVVTARNVDPGAFVPAATGGSVASGGAILTLMDFSVLRLQVAVPELPAALIAVGQPVVFTAESLPGRSWSGRIDRHAHALDSATRTLLIEADVSNADLRLRPGMYATARIGVEKHSQALTLPAAAVVQEKAAAYVFKHASGKAVRSPVKLGFNDGERIEIVDGLAEGEGVLLAKGGTLAHEQPVTLVESR